MRRYLPIIMMVGIAVTACGSKTQDAGYAIEATEASPSETATAPVLPELAYVHGRVVRGAGIANALLARDAAQPLNGWLSPVAVMSPDKSSIAYNTWRELREDDPAKSRSDQGIEAGTPLGHPAIYVFDSKTGQNTILADGASSIAWGRHGIAYVQGVDRDYRAGINWIGDIFVRSGSSSSPIKWSGEPAHYVAAAWARDTLIAYRVDPQEHLTLLAFDSPGKERVLSEGTLVSLSPDGRFAFVEATDATSCVYVIEISSGLKIASFDLRKSPLAEQVVSYAGSWESDLIAARTSRGLAVFRFDGTQISLLEAMDLSSSRYPFSAIEPHFINGGKSVQATVSIPSDLGLRTTMLQWSIGQGEASWSPEVEGDVHYFDNPSR